MCLETQFKTLDGRIFTQTDGTPIGKSISGPLADIYMNWFETEHIIYIAKATNLEITSKYGKEAVMMFTYYGVEERKLWIVSSGE